MAVDRRDLWETAVRVCPSCGRPANDCLHCGRPFYPLRLDAKYCTAACRVAAMRDRRTAEGADDE